MVQAIGAAPPVKERKGNYRVRVYIRDAFVGDLLCSSAIGAHTAARFESAHGFAYFFDQRNKMHLYKWGRCLL